MTAGNRVFRHAIAWILGCWTFVTALLVASQPPIGLVSSITLGHVLGLSYVGPVYVTLFLRDRPWPWPQRFAVICITLIGWVPILHAVQRPLDLTGTIWNSAINLAAILSIAFAGKAIWRMHRASLALATAVRLREEAEQRSLGAMLAPHTLHNMLNVVYSATLSAPHRAPALVIRLSDMMRYLVDKGQQDYVAASEEWRFLEQYRDFVLDRSATAQIELKFEGDEDTPVPALMLASVFENAVKHGTEAAGTVYVSAYFATVETGFRFIVENKIGDVVQNGNQIGIDLVRQRLALMFPGRHRYLITVNHDRKVFRTEIFTW